MLSITRQEYNALLEIHRKITDFDYTLKSGCIECPFACNGACIHGELHNIIKLLKPYVHDEVLC